MMYRLKECDIDYLLVACKHYQSYTGSEYLWEKYESIIEKLKLYQEQNLYAERVEHAD
jgi:hypothetical protein